MHRIAVQSSNIRSVGYDAGAGALEVEFTSGSVYRYFEVPESEHERLMSAASKGQYFNRNIKDCYEYVQVS